VTVEHCSIKGLIDIDGDLKLSNCILYDGFQFNGSSKKSFVREIHEKIIYWDTTLNEESVITDDYIIKLD